MLKRKADCRASFEKHTRNVSPGNRILASQIKSLLFAKESSSSEKVEERSRIHDKVVLVALTRTYMYESEKDSSLCLPRMLQTSFMKEASRQRIYMTKVPLDFMLMSRSLYKMQTPDQESFAAER